ncbi:MAG: response regulator [Pseudomonadota bacterium]
MSGSTPSPPTILVVDDTAENLRLLSELLHGAGYRVRAVRSGAQALRAVEASRPDLVLLDILMPDMDGYQTCQALKQLVGLDDLPVIFLSTLDAPLDKVRAFEIGAVDYIPKPFQFEEVRARIDTHLGIARLQRDLQRRNMELLRLEAQRDDLVHMLVHDMRSPLTSVQLFLEAVGVEVAHAMDPETAKDLALATAGCRSLTRMIDDILDVSRLEQGATPLEWQPCAVRALLDQALEPIAALLRGHHVLVEAPDDLPVLWCDAGLIRRVVANLATNAARFSCAGGAITVRAVAGPAALRVEVSDQGQGVPEGYHEIIFEKFGQVPARERGARRSPGLGLAFCRLAVEAHAGAIGVESSLGLGSTFWFSLPWQGGEGERVGGAR